MNVLQAVVNVLVKFLRLSCFMIKVLAAAVYSYSKLPLKAYGWGRGWYAYSQFML